MTYDLHLASLSRIQWNTFFLNVEVWNLIQPQRNAGMLSPRIRDCLFAWMKLACHCFFDLLIAHLFLIFQYLINITPRFTVKLLKTVVTEYIGIKYTRIHKQISFTKSIIKEVRCERYQRGVKDIR